MNLRRVSSQGLYIIVVLAMILSTMASLAIPNGMARAAVESSSGIESTIPQTQLDSKDWAGVQDAPLLDENFDYGEPAGYLTAVSGGNWNAHSATGVNPVGYITTSLAMPSYASSGIGGSATFASGGGSREDVNRLLPAEQTSGTLYYAALINISQASTTGDYFMHFKNSSTGYSGRLFAKDFGGALQFGIATGSTSTTYGPTPFAYNTTYLVVVKLNMTTGASDVYVLDSCPSGEPTPLASATGTASIPIVAIAIRQGSNIVVGGIDGIRIATNWADAATCTTAPPATLTIAKTAPDTVDFNQSFDYTLTVGNSLGVTATQVVITDSLPISLTVENISDGGVLIDTNVVSWTIPTVGDGDTAIRTVTVAAPAAEGTLVNLDYGVWASNWMTFTMGDPVTTTVHDSDLITPIADARAEGAGWYGTIRGNVTVPAGIYRTNAFVIQDETGGMYIYAGTKPLPPMTLGDVIQIKGTLKLYNGLLEIDPLESVTWIDSGTIPNPLTTTTNNINNTQGWLIEVVQGTATWTTQPPAPGASDWSFSYNDSSGPVTVFVDKDTKIDMRGYTSPMFMRVIGFSGNYNGAQIMPRYQSDIIDRQPPIVTDTNPSTGASGVSPYHPLEATFNKSMDAATFNIASFTVNDASGLITGTVSYEDGTRTASFTPDAALTPFTTYTSTLTTDIKDIYAIPLAAPYIWSFSTGAADGTPPAIVGVSPLPDATQVPLSANVVITFTEDIHPSSLDKDHFILEGHFGTVPYTLSYNPTNFVVTLNPDAKLLPTTFYTATVMGTIADWAGNTLGEDFMWSFETSIEPPMLVFFGDLHNHTSISDGSGTPAQALAAGETAGFDFMAITDHSYAIDDAEWDNTLTAVENATNSSFVALRGFEYTQGAEGHINVYNTVRHAVRTNVAGCTYCDYTPNLEAGSTVQGFYEWVTISGTVGLDASGTVMQFNHPGWINFNDWTYHPEVSDIAKLEEVGNGNGTSYDFSEDQYIRSLDYGWRVGATNNADTHTTYWGTNTNHRTGVLMAELTKDALLEALRERRTFATEDKNFALRMKANGAWMGAEIANSGSIQFEIDGTDPDGEPAVLVQIITDQGKVAEQFEPNSASFTWTPLLDISTGVHYFYVKVTQSDGDRIVSSPVWTLGSEDISVTDLVIQPTIPTIYNPSLLEVRVTNRNSEARTVTVTMDVNGVYLTPSVEVTASGNGDAFANFSWQPVITGDVTVTAQIIGAPAGDNPDDNTSVLKLTVTDEQLPLILIDAGKGNMNAVGNEMQMFVADLSAHQYNVLKNLDELTVADLNPDMVKLLLITAPQYAYSSAELSAIADYLAAGGNLWLCGLSDYTGTVPWAAMIANRENAILAVIETRTSSQINMRMNDDEIIDANDNNGYVFGPVWGNFPSEYTTSIGINVEATASWSVNSLRGRNVTDPLTTSTPGVQIVVQGDLDVGYTQYGSYWDPNHTSNTDADGGNDAYIYNPTWVYPAYSNTVPLDAIPVPMAAITQLPNGAGRIMLYGDSNDAFTLYAYTAGDGKQNELFNLESAMWLMGEPLQLSTIAEARDQTVVNQPDKLNKLVWVEGEITAAYGEFFNMLYVQDATGGIAVHAPAGDIDPSSYTRGTKVRVVGTVGIYNGDTEIEFFEAEMVQVISPSTGEPQPLPMSTFQASLEGNQGWLTVITGTVTSKLGEDNLFIDDGSGPVRIFLDGYNGDFADIQVADLVRVTGLVSEDGDGQRIRVRNHEMHPEYADDVVKLVYVLGITKAVTTPEMVLPGSLVTYMLVLSNTGSLPVLQSSLTDTLPSGVTFGGFISDGGAAEQNGTISWAGDIPVGMEINVVFTATVDMNYDLYGETITNTVEYASPNSGTGSASAAFTVAGAPDVTIEKSVAVPEVLNPGSVITYTLSLANIGEAAALNLALVDTLPTGITFGAWILQNGADVFNGVITWDGDLSGEREFVFTAIVDYDPSGYAQPIMNTVEFTSTNAGSGSAAATFTVVPPILSIDKSVVTTHDPALPGDPIAYTLVVHNDGTTGAVGVHIWDTLPEGVIGSNVDVTTTINTGEAYTITVQATLAMDVMRGSSIINTAYYKSGDLFGESTASFTVATLNKIYLPLIRRH